VRAAAGSLTAALALLLAAAGSAAPAAPVLGIDVRQGSLAWYDAGTLRRLPAKATKAHGWCSWSFSPARTQVAISDCRGSLELVDLKAMRPLVRLDVGGKLGAVDGVAWLRPDRLVAVSRVGERTRLLVVDTSRGRVVRTVDLGRPASNRTIVGDRAVYLLGSSGSFRPAQVAVVDADGAVRRATVDRISIGTIVGEDANGNPSSMQSRQPGFAVDAAGGRAFVVSPVLLVAEVDLATLAVAYHGPVRTLSKFNEGPMRVAAWLGGSKLAVAGADHAFDGKTSTTTPFGLRVVDTQTWTAQTIDPAATFFQPIAGGMLTGDGTGWSAGGRQLFHVALGRQTWLNVAGPYVYVCRGYDALRVLDARTGAQVASAGGRACPRILRGRASAS
jgi:hypothetical protein